MHLPFGSNRNLVWFFLLFLFFMHPGALSGSEPNQIINEELENNVKYEISIKDNLITLNAADAFLKKILEDIGQRMNIEVFAGIPAEDKITIQFANLPLEEVLKKFKTNYALVTDSKDKNGNIRRIVVVPEGQQANLSLKDVRKDEPKALKDVRKDEPKALKEVRKDEPKVKKDIAEEKTSRPEPFKFEFDPSEFIKKGN